MSPIQEVACSDPAALSEATDQRQHDRYICLDGGTLRLAVRPEYKGRRALLVDTSAGGVGFLLEAPLEPGTMLALELGDSGSGDARGRVARVRHCRPHPAPANAPWLPRTPPLARFLRRLLGTPAPQEQAWLIGCESTRPLEEHELKELLALLSRPNGK